MISNKTTRCRISFDRFFDGRGDAPPAAERSLGSGVIVDKRDSF